MALPQDLKITIKNFITSRSGLYFKDHDLKDLESAIAKRMHILKLESPLSYYNLLTVAAEKDDEFRELLNLLTVNHTYFFRNEPQFKVFKEKIIPELISRTINSGEKAKLRIWSAGCSTGEEPYTIAMILKEIIPDLGSWEVEILATDVSAQALRKAKTGVYSEMSMRLAEQYYKDRYFKSCVDSESGLKGYQISDEIKSMVRFEFFNLMQEEYPKNFDIIFCRNVVIYFELDTTVKVMSKIHESLKDEGFLFIGYSETLQFISDKFRMFDWEDAIYYGKGERAGLISKAKEYEPQYVTRDDILDEISRAEVSSELKETIDDTPAFKRIEELLIRIVKCLHSKQYELAVDLAEEVHKIDKNKAEPYYLAAEALANQGKLKEAREKINSVLKLNALFVPAHYLLGSFYTEEGQTENAKSAFKKALYLDGNFILAHFGIANIYKNENKKGEAIREYRNTLNLLAKLPSTDIIPYSGGFNATAIAGACKGNIERLKFGF